MGNRFLVSAGAWLALAAVGASGQEKNSLTRTSVTLAGFVLAPDGSPVEGAVVTSSAGGSAVTDVAGNYQFEVDVPRDATSLQVAAAHGAGSSPSASASVALTPLAGTARVDPLVLALGASCSPGWQPTFGRVTDVNAEVFALAVYDDGRGPALYAGGSFTEVRGVTAHRIGRWDGSSWSAVGGGMDRFVHALATYDDGHGPALYAGGEFATAGGVVAKGMARWDGSSWAALGSGVSRVGSVPRVRALTVYDDGTGPALYAGGEFTGAGGVAANGIARWNGSSWSALGTGLTGLLGGTSVRALAVYDDGNGPALYVGGVFTKAGGSTAPGLAKWNGSSWSNVGGWSNGVGALAVYDDGSGASLYAGGASVAARWDGSSWSTLAGGTNGDIQALAVHDDGSGPALYAGGTFTSTGGVAALRIAKWDGASWSALGGGVNPAAASVHALAVFDDGRGPSLHAGGSFTSAGELQTKGIARWDGSRWGYVGHGIVGHVLALTVHDGAGPPELYAGGSFLSTDDEPAQRIAKWDGSSWSALGSGMNSSVRALAVHDDGSGPMLHAGGAFTRAGGVTVNRIARWDGRRWSALGSGMDGDVRALASIRGARLQVAGRVLGTPLYAGGNFTSAGGVTAKRIAKWERSVWSPLGSGMNSRVNALALFDDGNGSALYAGGAFTLAGGTAASRIARWDGASWSALASGLDAEVLALAVYDDGGGPALYAGGWFTSAGGVAAIEKIAKWDGASWSALGSGMNGPVTALEVYDDGRGPALYVGGIFTSAGGVAAAGIARWNGSIWSPLGGGVDHSVQAMAVYDDGTGPALFAGGPFKSAIDSGDAYLAKWAVPQDLDPPTISCPPSLVVPDEFGSAPGEVVNFTVMASDCRDPFPTVVTVPPSGSFFPRGTTLVTAFAVDQSGNQSTCQFAVTVALEARRR